MRLVEKSTRRRQAILRLPVTRVYSGGMKTILIVLLLIDMLAVAAVLLAGMFSMVDRAHDPHKSNRLMRWRVTLQAVAVGLILLLMVAG